jgi:hypothetical protein
MLNSEFQMYLFITLWQYNTMVYEKIFLHYPVVV